MSSARNSGLHAAKSQSGPARVRPEFGRIRRMVLSPECDLDE
jgi:hypothetical protein